jgi:HEAT repeat protein
MEALGRIGPAAKEALTLLERLAKEEKEDFIRRAAVVAITRITSSSELESLLKRLAMADEILQKEACRALGDLGPQAEAAVPALAKMLSHETPHLRGEAAAALGRIGPAARSTLPTLRELADTTNGAYLRRQYERAIASIERAPQPAPQDRSGAPRRRR